MNVLIIGGGKVGYYLAITLEEHGHHPVIIEHNQSVCERIANALDIPVIHGDGTTIEALALAKAARMDALVSVTGHDEDNLISCQLGKKLFHIPKTVARVNNPKNAVAVRALGVDITVNSTNHIVHLIEREMSADILHELLSVDERGDFTISELLLPSPYALENQPLSQIPLPEDTVIIAITRGGQLVVPRGNTPLQSGDKVLLLAKNTSTAQLKKALKL